MIETAPYILLSNLSSHLAQIFNVYISSIGENKVTNYFEIIFFVLPFCVTWKRGPLRSIMCSCSLSIHSSCSSLIKVMFSSSYLCGIHLINNMTLKWFSLLKSWEINWDHASLLYLIPLSSAFLTHYLMLHSP